MSDPELVAAAANRLCWRGYVEPDEHDRVDDEVLAELALVAAAYPQAATPDKLADYWLVERQEAYERSIPTWTCGCGTEFKVIGRWPRDETLYRAVDGLVGDLAGEIRHDSKGRLKHSDNCPVCHADYHDTMTRQLEPQLALF